MEGSQGEWGYPEKEKAHLQLIAEDLMLRLFQRKTMTQAPQPATNFAEPAKGFMLPQSAATLLATPRRQKLLEHIWQRTSLSRKQFAWLYEAPILRYAELVQSFPASESHHHSYPGGMLDHGLEIVAYALKLRQSYLLPVGANPEDQSAQAEAWTAATAYAALLHDAGKIAVDLMVEQADGASWHPWHGPLRQPYRFRYREDREYRLHSAATGVVYHQLLDSMILDWLCGYQEMWSSLLYVLAGQYEHAGTLGELVVQADRASVAQELGGDPARAMAAPKHALQRKLLDGLRYLLKEELKLNQPQASDGWLTQEALWLVSKTVSDKLRAHLLSMGIDGIPANNTAVFNVLQDHGMLLPTSEGKAIWKATVVSASGWSNSFTFLKLSPALIWEGSERPAAFPGSITVAADEVQGAAVDPNAIAAGESAAVTKSDSLPQAPSLPQVDGVEALLNLFAEAPRPSTAIVDTNDPDLRPEPSTGLDATAIVTSATSKAPMVPTMAANTAEHFVQWLHDRVAERKLIINDAKALVHTVADTAFLVSPGVFQRYSQEHPQVAGWAKLENQQDWQWVQKGFERLQLHRKNQSGHNIWTCEVTGPRKSRRLHGYLLETPKVLFSEVPPNNPYLTIDTKLL